MKLLSIVFLAGVLSSAHAQNPVVIELFTSQGCSSCPPADDNLAEIVKSAEKNGQQIFGLSYHVDYWNYLGWKDPYSKKEFTERQKRYASIMNSEGVYTPQMIVNGKKEFVGSDGKKSSAIVAEALHQEMQYLVSVVDFKRSEEKVLISYSIDKIPINQTINVALVEKNVGNEVTRGENSGKKLAHKNTVRSFISVAAQKNGQIEISLPAPSKADLAVIFTQDGEWHITGACQKTF